MKQPFLPNSEVRTLVQDATNNGHERSAKKAWRRIQNISDDSLIRLNLLTTEDAKLRAGRLFTLHENLWKRAGRKDEFPFTDENYTSSINGQFTGPKVEEIEANMQPRPMEKTTDDSVTLLENENQKIAYRRALQYTEFLDQQLQ